MLSEGQVYMVFAKDILLFLFFLLICFRISHIVIMNRMKYLEIFPPPEIFDFVN